MGRTVLECDGGDAAIVHDDVVYDLLEEAVRDGGVNGSDVLLVVDVAVFDQLVRHDVVGWLTFQKKHHLTRGVLLDKHLCKLYRLKRKEETENAEQDNLDGQIDP